MDSNRMSKRRSFPKSKLIRSFYRAATASKPSGAAVQPYISKSAPGASVAHQQKPKGPTSSATAGSHVGFIIMNPDQVFPQQTSKVAFVVTNDGDSYGKLESFCGADDEGVDAKASKYISSVKERFRLERSYSERNVEDICV